MKIGSIVVRCYEFEKMLAFWQQALHYVPRGPAKGRPRAAGWFFLILKEEGPTCLWTKFPKSAQAKGVDCISTSIQTTDRVRWSGWSSSGRLAIHGDINRAIILSSWKIPTATSSAWFR